MKWPQFENLCQLEAELESQGYSVELRHPARMAGYSLHFDKEAVVKAWEKDKRLREIIERCCEDVTEPERRKARDEFFAYIDANPGAATSFLRSLPAFERDAEAAQRAAKDALACATTRSWCRDRAFREKLSACATSGSKAERDSAWESFNAYTRDDRLPQLNNASYAALQESAVDSMKRDSEFQSIVERYAASTCSEERDVASNDLSLLLQQKYSMAVNVDAWRIAHEAYWEVWRKSNRHLSEKARRKVRDDFREERISFWRQRSNSDGQHDENFAFQNLHCLSAEEQAEAWPATRAEQVQRFPLSIGDWSPIRIAATAALIAVVPIVAANVISNALSLQARIVSPTATVSILIAVACLIGMLHIHSDMNRKPSSTRRRPNWLSVRDFLKTPIRDIAVARKCDACIVKRNDLPDQPELWLVGESYFVNGLHGTPWQHVKLTLGIFAVAVLLPFFIGLPLALAVGASLWIPGFIGVFVGLAAISSFRHVASYLQLFVCSFITPRFSQVPLVIEFAPDAVFIYANGKSEAIRLKPGDQLSFAVGSHRFSRGVVIGDSSPSLLELFQFAWTQAGRLVVQVNHGRETTLANIVPEDSAEDFLRVLNRASELAYGKNAVGRSRYSTTVDTDE